MYGRLVVPQQQDRLVRVLLLLAMPLVKIVLVQIQIVLSVLRAIYGVLAQLDLILVHLATVLILPVNPEVTVLVPKQNALRVPQATLEQ